MLQAKNREQLESIKEMLQPTSVWLSDDLDGIHIDDWLTFDEMAKVVDYLRSQKKKIAVDLSIVSPQMMEVVTTWLDYKKEKHQTYKPTGFKTFYKKLCEMSGNNPQVAMQMVEFSMQNNYSGLFPLRNNNQNNNNYGRETITDKIRRTVENANKFSEQLRNNIGKQADVCDGDTDEAW